jgi:hypothetical protein
MKFGQADFRKIQASLLAAVLMSAVGAAVVLVSLERTKIAEMAEKTASKDRNEFSGKLKQVRSEENEIKTKSALFSTLQARGIIGEEQRLDWVELLKDIRDKRRLIDLQYEISPQRPLDANASNGLTFYASAMKLQLKLLHEEDLTRLLEDLRSQAKAQIQVKNCNVSRLPRSSGEPGNDNGYPRGPSPSALLQADCLIDWITVREAASK